MSDKFDLIDPDDLKSVPSTKYLIDGLIPLGEITFFCGAPKHLKTMLMISCLCSVATGRPWFERAVRQGKVAYIIGEGGDAFLGRVKAWQKSNEVDSFNGNFRIIKRAVNLADQKAEGLMELIQKLKEKEFQPDVIAFDTLNRSMPGVAEDTQNLSLVFERFAMLQEWAPGASIAVAHHNKKGEMVFRGGQVIAGNADGLIYVDRPDMQVLKANVTCDWFRNAANFEPFSFTCAPVSVLTDDGMQDFIVVDGLGIVGEAEARNEAKEDKKSAVLEAKVAAFEILQIVGRYKYNAWQRDTKTRLQVKPKDPTKGLGNDTFKFAVAALVKQGTVILGPDAYYQIAAHAKSGCVGDSVFTPAPRVDPSTPTPTPVPLRGTGVSGVGVVTPGEYSRSIRSGSNKSRSDQNPVEHDEQNDTASVLDSAAEQLIGKKVG